MSYSFSAIAYLVLAVLLTVSWRGRLEGGVLLAAVIIQILWSVVIAYQSYTLTESVHLMLTFEVLRLSVWNIFILRLIRLGEIRKFYRGFTLFIYLVAGAGFSTVAITYFIDIYELTDAIRRSFLFACLLLAILGVVLTEQLYRNIKPENRWAIKFLCIGMALLFVYDVYMYSETMLMGQVNESLWVARGAVGVMVVPLIAISAARNPKWSFEIFVSRQIVFYSTGVLAISTYLILMALAGYYIREYGGDWGAFAQILFLAGTAVLLFVVIASDKTRSLIKVFLSKHFYKNKYDYREEWLRLIHNISEYKTSKYFRENIIQTVAGLMQSHGGLLFIHDSGEYVCSATWNAPEPVNTISASSSLSIFANKKEWIIEVKEYQANREIYDKLELPEWILSITGVWLIIPLKHYYKLLGFIILLESPTVKSVNWEDRDFLKAIARQISSYLAFIHASEELSEAQQFSAFNRLSAYLVHDLKNLVSQLELTVINYEHYQDNPEFISDAMQTVRNVVQRMQKMLAQLRKMEFKLENSRQVNVHELLKEVVRKRAAQLPEPVLRIESEVSVMVEPDRFINSIEHIIQNAQEACQPGGEVIVELSTDNDMMVISVKDNGCGMDKSFINERLFRPFDTTKGNAGMGIGVFEVKEFVKHHGGRIEVNSKPGLGTNFMIKLPLS